MLVKDIVKVACEYLELKNIVECIDNKIEKTDDIEEEIRCLILAVNMVNSSVAASYIELISNKTVYTDENKKINYNDIDTRGIIEIKKVYNGSGCNIGFKLMPGGIIVEESQDCFIEYSHFPDSVELEDNIDYYLKLNKYIFAMGVVAEYLYIKGNVDDAYMWDKRFKNSMLNVVRPRRSITIPERRW